jgi:hypothetical protein
LPDGHRSNISHGWARILADKASGISRVYPW